MSDFLEIFNGTTQPALSADHLWPGALHGVAGLGVYTAAVFVFGYLTARARWAALHDSVETASYRETEAADAARECDVLLAEIRQELDSHSDSARLLDEKLDSSDRDVICDQAMETRAENSEFQQFLDDRCSKLEVHSQHRGGALKYFITTLAGHRRRSDELEVVLARFENRDQFESAISPLRACIRDLQDHNRHLQAELDATRMAVAQQSQQLEVAQEEARIDALTGLPNRRAFDEKIGELHSLFDRGNSPYTVALLDVDHFKTFNDEHGHAIGDKVLRFVADVLRGTQRWTDHIARFGGEEFVILLPRINGHKAKFVIDRHREKIERAALKINHQNLSVTISAGVAEVFPGDTIAKVLARADQALYAAKAAGRNQTCLEDGGSIVEVSQLRLQEEIAHLQTS